MLVANVVSATVVYLASDCLSMWRYYCQLQQAQQHYY